MKSWLGFVFVSVMFHSSLKKKWEYILQVLSRTCSSHIYSLLREKIKVVLNTDIRANACIFQDGGVSVKIEARELAVRGKPITHTGVAVRLAQPKCLSLVPSTPKWRGTEKSYP